MIVDTPHGEFEVKNITRKERRKFYKRVKEVFTSKDLSQLHDLGDEFALLAFVDEKVIEEKLGHLTAVNEDEVLASIISAYMGLDLGNPTGG
jgi:hypothetical protein